VRDLQEVSDPRLDPAAYGQDWLPGVHERQLQRLGLRS